MAARRCRSSSLSRQARIFRLVVAMSPCLLRRVDGRRRARDGMSLCELEDVGVVSSEDSKILTENGGVCVGD